MEQTGDKLRLIEEGLKYLAELDLIDPFYDEIWKKNASRLLERYIEEKEYHDIPLEGMDKVKKHVVEWFGEDYGLAEINGEFWIVSVGSVDEGGNKSWFRIKINADNLETARRVILFDRCMPGKYCNLYVLPSRSGET